MTLENNLRQLARSMYYQLRYKNAKEIGIPLFENRKSLSGLQLMMVYWLNLYSQLYRNMDSDEHLSVDVIDNDIRLDAYFVLKKVEREKEKRKIVKQKIRNKLKGKNQENVSDTYFYRKKDKKI